MKKDEFQKSSKVQGAKDKDGSGKASAAIIALPAAPKFQGPRPPAPRPSFAPPPIQAAVQVKLLPPVTIIAISPVAKETAEKPDGAEELPTSSQ